jgi:hypothetical protein
MDYFEKQLHWEHGTRQGEYLESEWWGPPLVQEEKYHEKPHDDDDDDDDNTISVKLNSYIFTCRLNPEANCKVSMSMKDETTTKHLQTKYKTRYFMQ